MRGLAPKAAPSLQTFTPKPCQPCRTPLRRRACPASAPARRRVREARPGSTRPRPCPTTRKPARARNVAS
eukprot:6229015-Alexandrium_andersonii.AAC.1